MRVQALAVAAAPKERENQRERESFVENVVQCHGRCRHGPVAAPPPPRPRGRPRAAPRRGASERVSRGGPGPSRAQGESIAEGEERFARRASCFCFFLRFDAIKNREACFSRPRPRATGKRLRALSPALSDASWSIQLSQRTGRDKTRDRARGSFCPRATFVLGEPSPPSPWQMSAASPGSALDGKKTRSARKRKGESPRAISPQTCRMRQRDINEALVDTGERLGAVVPACEAVVFFSSR